MMVRAFLLLVAAASVPLVATSSCGRDEASGGGARLRIDVAALSLPGVVDASYTLTVENAAGETVWTRAVTSQAYGDGAGGISYIGPCDADSPAHTVVLTLDGLSDADGPIPNDTWFNPTPLTRSATCAVNTDTPVTFDITIARAATQGFFDAAVSFDDLFCSAKLDCGATTDPADDLLLLHTPAGDRGMTAVLGLACTGGTAADTHVYLDDVVIDCGGALTRVAVGEPGNVDLSAAPSANPEGYLFAAQVSRGAEALAHKIYWNVALGLATPLPASTCTLTTRATASDGPLAGNTTAAATTYPFIGWQVVLSDAGARACTQHPLNGTPTGVASDYTDGEAATTFMHAASLPGLCTTDAGCDDGDGCTVDFCDGGVCRNDSCAALGETCLAGACSGAVGTLQNPAISCSAILAAGVTTDGVYYVDPDGDGGAPAGPVYCDLTGGGWTLVESFSLANNALVSTSFANDAPQSTADPESFALFRLPKDRMAALEAVSTEWMATCDLDTSETRDFLRAPMSEARPTELDALPRCARVTAADIRGYGCSGCIVGLYQDAATYHLHTDASLTACGATPWNAGAIASEDDFGHYVTPNAAFGCTASSSSTTNWWFRTRACAPNGLYCDGDAVMQCDAYGVAGTLVEDCAVSGQVCTGSACAALGSATAPAESCSALADAGYTDDGAYWVDADGAGGAAAGLVWCDMGGGWTLLESYAFANNAIVRVSPLSVDLPLGTTAPLDLSLYRLPKDRMVALEDVSDEWMMTCDLDTSETRDFLLGRLTALRPTTYDAYGTCIDLVAADIRGHSCTSCQAPMYQGTGDNYHLCTDSSVSSCGVPWSGDAVASEDDFGYYGVTNPLFRCVDTPDSTSQMWVRTRVCVPGEVSCDSNTAYQCNALGTGFDALYTCPDGQYCIGAGTCSTIITTCADLVGTGATDGVYTLDPDGVGVGMDAFDAWCDADAGWTLIESFSFGNNAVVRSARFGLDSPQNETDPTNHALHRLSLAKIQALQAASSESMATCNMDTTETVDFVRTPLSNMVLTTSSGTPFCAVATAANIRGYGCVGCNVPWWQSSAYHLVTDSTVTSCDGPRPWNTGASYSEDDFGYYGYYNTAFSCVTTSASTTNWWLR